MTLFFRRRNWKKFIQFLFNFAMLLDIKLTQIALKTKNLVVMDLSFPHMKFPEFKKAYEGRYIHLPCRKEMAVPMAAGLSSFGKLIVIFGDDCSNCTIPDGTLNVKVLKESPEGSWEQLEEGLKSFGSAVLLIPEED